MDESRPSSWTSMQGWLSPAVLFLLVNLIIGTIAVTSRSLRSRRGGGQRLSDQQSVGMQSENESQPFTRGSSSSFGLFRNLSIYRSRSGDDDFSPADHGGAVTPHATPSYIAEAPPQRYASAPLQRVPSFVLERLRSIGLQRLRSGVFSSAENDHVEPNSLASQSNDSSPLSRGPSFVLERLRSIGLRRFLSGNTAEDDDPNAEDDTTASQRTGGVGDHSHYDRSMSDSREVAAGKLAGKMKKSASAGSAFAHFSASDVARSRAAKGVPEEHDEDVDARAEDFISRFKQQLKLQRLDSIARYKKALLNRGRQS